MGNNNLLIKVYWEPQPRGSLKYHALGGSNPLIPVNGLSKVIIGQIIRYIPRPLVHSFIPA